MVVVGGGGGGGGMGRGGMEWSEWGEGDTPPLPWDTLE